MKIKIIETNVFGQLYNKWTFEIWLICSNFMIYIWFLCIDWTIILFLNIMKYSQKYRFFFPWMTMNILQHKICQKYQTIASFHPSFYSLQQAQFHKPKLYDQPTCYSTVSIHENHISNMFFNWYPWNNNSHKKIGEYVCMQILVIETLQEFIYTL